jgi:hypothetical protein
MITQLQKIINELSQLSKAEQNAIATLIQEELSWDRTLQNPSAKLSKLAKEALKEHQENKTEKGDW